MDVMELLEQTYGWDTPILLNKLNIQGTSPNGLRQTMTRLTKSGQLSRFSPGIYFIPTTSRIGESTLSITKVLERKYITDGEIVYGFYAGLSLENQLGLTTQMPNVMEIVTNNVNSRVRIVNLYGLKAHLRKCPVLITSNNIVDLQFIDFINRYDMQKLSEERIYRIVRYIQEKEIKKNNIFHYISCFPSSAAKKLGIYNAIIEKDYFVTLFLKNLVVKEPRIIFKGGALRYLNVIN